MDPIRFSSADLNLPLGYKFAPTSVELLQHYLIPKLRGEKLLSDCIMNLDDFYSYEPRQLPLNQFKHAKEDEAFFFTTDVKQNSVEESQIRITSNGYWKVCKDDVAVEIDGELIGFETKFAFHDVHGNKTDWRMIEYRCHPAQIPSNAKNYIVCKIKLKPEVEEKLPDDTWRF